MASPTWHRHLRLLPLLCSGLFSLAYALQDGSPQTADAVPEPNSNRVVWRDGARGASTAVRGSLEFKYLRYSGLLVQTYLRSYGSGLAAYVSVTNANDTPCVFDSKDDISIQMRLLQEYLLPMETEQLVKSLQKDSKHNKEIVQDIQKKPWTLGPVTINRRTTWEQIFYFHPNTEQLFTSVLLYKRELKPFDIQVYLNGVAFVFPFKVAEP